MYTVIFERLDDRPKEILRYTVDSSGKAIPSNPKSPWHREFSLNGIRVVLDKEKGKLSVVRVERGEEFIKALPLYLNRAYLWAVYNPK